MDEGYSEESQEISSAGRRPSPLPWVLFALSVLAAALITVVLLIKVDGEKQRAIAAQQALEDIQGKISHLESTNKSLQSQVDQLTSDKATIASERDALQAKLQASAHPVKPEKASKKKGGGKKKHR